MIEFHMCNPQVIAILITWVSLILDAFITAQEFLF